METFTITLTLPKTETVTVRGTERTLDLTSIHINGHNRIYEYGLGRILNDAFGSDDGKGPARVDGKWKSLQDGTATRSGGGPRLSIEERAVRDVLAAFYQGHGAKRVDAEAAAKAGMSGFAEFIKSKLPAGTSNEVVVEKTKANWAKVIAPAAAKQVAALKAAMATDTTLDL